MQIKYLSNIHNDIRGYNQLIKLYEEYKTLENEFDVILKQMEFIDKIDGIEEVTLMTFPFELNLDDDYLREDVYKNEIDFNDMVINVKDYDDNRVKVPKVVE